MIKVGCIPPAESPRAVRVPLATALRLKFREIREANKEVLAEKKRQYYEANKERLTAYMRDYMRARRARGVSAT